MTRLPGMLVVLVGLSIPMAAASVSAPVGSTPTTLYMHLLNFQDFPINTQVPDPDFVENGPFGLATHSLSCAPNPPSARPFDDWHTWHGYSSPSYVEYDFEQDGRPRVHPQRGLSWNVSLDAGVEPVLHWYLIQRLGPDPLDAGVPAPLPNVVVEATLRGPDSVSLDDTTFDTGPVIASGRSVPALLAGEATQGAEHFMAGANHVYGFTVPLAYAAESISESTGYTVTVQAFVENAACGDGHVMPAEFAPYADADHWPRIELAARDVLRVQGLQAFEVNGTIVVGASFNAVWGSYDVDEGNVTLTVEGPEGPVAVTLASFIHRTHEHYHLTEPVQAAWTLPDDLPAGLYWVNLTVRNDQHTATTTARAAFQTGPFVSYPAVANGTPPVTTGQSQAMPALGPAGLVLALAGLAMAARRQGKR